MPEGPEAAFLSDRLNRTTIHHTLDSVEFVKGRYVTHGPPKNYAEFSEALPLRLEKVTNKGKVIFFHFEKGWYIVSRLGMTGWWYAGEEERPRWRSEFISVRMTFSAITSKPTQNTTSKPTSNTCIIYSDPRSYGTLTFIKDITKDLSELAPDIMAAETTWNMFKERIALKLARRTNQVKPLELVLSDQKLLMSGIGNYLKSEILYSAGISPKREIREMSETEWHTIYTLSRGISAKFLKALNSKRETAYEAQMQVYGKKEDPQGNPITSYLNKEKRMVHWVPAVQK